MQYRSEIDGLRALAIVPVILFHAGFSTFSGGYLGVDVFFVISGYLITSLVQEQMADGHFSFKRFYERRARRLFPALFLVTLASMPFAWAWIPPDDFIEYSQSLVAMTLFIANIFFQAQSGYFDTAAELKPFLHTWSLSIEEQYYFIFPALLLLLLKVCQQRAWLVLLVVTLASFAACQATMSTKPSAAFFQFQLRAWELMAGSACALWSKAHKSAIEALPGAVRDLLAALGLASVVLAMGVLDQNTRHPGWATGIPVVGTAMVLVFCTPSGHTGQLLGWQPFVRIGLLSYGAYLWHQPLFALARQWQFSEPGLSMSLMLVLLTFALAALSLAFVERPVRAGELLPGNRIFLFWSIGSGVLLALGAIGMEKEGWSNRFKLPAQVQTSLADHSPRGVCEPYKDGNGIDANFCWLGTDAPSSRAKAAVFGDSHAFPITAAFDEPAKALRVAVVQSGIGGCLPLIGANVIDGPNPFSSCSALAERQLRLVKERGITQVFLIARWSLYTSLGYDERKMYHVGAAQTAPRTLSHSLSSFERALTKTVEAYAEAGAQVVLVSQLPQQVTHPLSVYYKVYSDSFRGDAQEAIDFASIDLERHLSIQQISRRLFNAVSVYHDNVKHLVLDEVYCAASKCRMGTPTTAYYSDTNHISTDGALLARARFQAMLQSAITPRLNSPAPASPK